MGRERAVRELVSATHPLVIRHLVTGQPSLFMSPAVTCGIENFLSKELNTLLKFLHGHIWSLDLANASTGRKGLCWFGIRGA